MQSDPTTPSSDGVQPNSASTIHTHGPAQDAFRVIRKRNRVPLSCAPCRNRKLKCNRGHPCENCVKRADAASCSYAAPGARRKPGSRSNSTGTPDEMQVRIDRLEGLVLSLVNNGGDGPDNGGGANGHSAVARALSMSSPSGSGASQSLSPMMHEEDGAFGEDAESETDKVAKSFGVLRFHNEKSMYLGETHWGAILDDISEVKNYFHEHKKQYEDALKKVEAAKRQAGVVFTGPAFIIGGRNPPLMTDLLSSLPGRDAVDKLITRFFYKLEAPYRLLHPKSWYRKYERHWNDPSSTSPEYLGQIFAICGLALQFTHRQNDEFPEYRGRSTALAVNFRQLTQQCLMLADYVKPQMDVIETYMLHMMSEWSKTREADTGIWMLSGTVIRLCMRVGLHRDPSHFPEVSPFQAQTRRRLWTALYSWDVLFSFSVSLPSMIRDGDTDTQPPANLDEDEYDEDSAVLPPAHPLSHMTSNTYTITKFTLSRVFGRIMVATQSTSPLLYEDVMRLDRELLETLHNLPSHLQMRPLEETFQDDEYVTAARFHLSVLFHKAVCILHRTFLVRARTNSRYAHSRRASVDSAMSLLRIQDLVFRHSSIAGTMCRGMIDIKNSFFIHDLILASALVSLDVLQGVQADAAQALNGAQPPPSGISGSSSDMDLWGSDRREEMLGALERSLMVWNELKPTSIEAYKAHALIGTMIQKIEATRAQTAARMAQGAFAFVTNDANSPSNGSATSRAATTGAASSRSGRSGRSGISGATSSLSASSLSSPAGQVLGSPEEEKPEHSAAITLGMLSSGAMAAAKGSSLDGPTSANPLSSNGSTQGNQANFPDPLNPLQDAGNNDANLNTAMTDFPTQGLPPGFNLDSMGSGAGFNAANSFGLLNGSDLDVSTALDWNAWDSFIQSSSANPAANTGLTPGPTDGSWGTFMDYSSTAPTGPSNETSRPPGAVSNGIGGAGGASNPARNGVNGDATVQGLNSNLFANPPGLFTPGGPM